MRAGDSPCISTTFGLSGRLLLLTIQIQFLVLVEKQISVLLYSNSMALEMHRIRDAAQNEGL